MTVRCPRCATRYRLPGRAKPGSDVTYRCARCQLVFQADAAAEEPRVLEPEDAAAEDEEEQFVFDEDEEPEVESAAVRLPAPPPAAAGFGVGSPPRFALRGMLAVTFGYAVLSIYLYTHPESVRTLLGPVPLIGPRLVETSLSPSSVQLTDLRGEYVRVQGDQLVFVISGTAINNSPIPVKGIQVEGMIIGSRAERRIVFCGTAPHDVPELSVREIALLQTLEPPKDWVLRPGEQTSFVVIFVAPPTDLRDFSAEVVAVQGRQRHRGAPEPVPPL